MEYPSDLMVIFLLCEKLKNEAPMSIATFRIFHMFRITGRGFVFAGHITDGMMKNGDKISFEYQSEVYSTKISSIEFVRSANRDINVGLVLEDIPLFQEAHFSTDLIENQIAEIINQS